MVKPKWFAVALLVLLSIVFILGIRLIPVVFWQTRDCRPSDQVRFHYWDSAPDGVYEVEYYEQDLSDGYVGFPNCPSCPTELHGEWAVGSSVGFNESGTYEVTLIDNKIIEARSD